MSDRTEHAWRRKPRLGRARKAYGERQREADRRLQPAMKQDFLQRLAARQAAEAAHRDLPDRAA